MRLIRGDALTVLREMEAETAHCCITSPPYFGLRDYGVASQIGLEKSPGAYVERLVEVFREVRRVLRNDATCWISLGDSYAGSWGNQGRKAERGTQRPINGEMLQPVLDGRYPDKGSNTGAVPPGFKPKDLLGVPWRVAFALQADGWYLRSDIIWHKPNPMPESVRDRPTKSHEYIFLLSKSPKYFYDANAVKEEATSFGRQHSSRVPPPKARGLHAKGLNGQFHHGRGGSLSINYERRSRNRRSVWTVATRGYPGAHFATFPPALVEPCVLAGCPEGGTVLDPFAGACTTGLVALGHGRDFVGIDLNGEYLKMGRRRLAEARAKEPADEGDRPRA